MFRPHCGPNIRQHRLRILASLLRVVKLVRLYYFPYPTGVLLLRLLCFTLPLSILVQGRGYQIRGVPTAGLRHSIQFLQ